MRTANAASLLLIDEFGKGTGDTDGRALLTACAEHLLHRPRPTRPFVLLSTHFHEVKTSLRGAGGGGGGGVKFYSFRHTQNDLGELVFLYQLEQQSDQEYSGSASSKALLVAKKAGVDDDVVRRGAEVLRLLIDGNLKRLKADNKLFPVGRIEETVENFFRAELESVEDAEKVLSTFNSE